jgi:hypothetical protein
MKIKSRLRTTALAGLGLIVSCASCLPISESGQITEEPVSPNASHYATKVWYVDALTGSRQENMTGGCDNGYGSFICLKDRPLEVVVEFARPFNYVLVDARHSGRFHVEGYGARWYNHLPGPRVMGPFEIIEGMGEGGDSTNDPNIEQSSYIKIDTGYVKEKLFGFSAWPLDDNGNGKEFKINCFECK